MCDTWILTSWMGRRALSRYGSIVRYHERLSGCDCHDCKCLRAPPESRQDQNLVNRARGMYYAEGQVPGAKRANGGFRF